MPIPPVPNQNLGHGFQDLLVPDFGEAAILLLSRYQVPLVIDLWQFGSQAELTLPAPGSMSAVERVSTWFLVVEVGHMFPLCLHLTMSYL